MPLLIDGYNLLHMLGWIDSRRGPKALEQARWRLVRFLVGVLSPAERAGTTVVFDAAEPPPLVARTLQAEGITVRFAVGYRNADELLEELIDQAKAPRSYVVVSSDRRVQRAALRRQMKAVDCWTWYERQLAKRPHVHRPPTPNAEPRPAWTYLPLSESEVEHWVRVFSGPEGCQSNQPIFNPPTELPDLFQSPFPPGYGEDVEEE
jgi:predicted RNA-binding protein with PIN domain